MRNFKPRRRQQSKGIALIEALVAILILSIGILGLVGLQVSMTSAQSSAKYRGDAAYLANELIGALWTDKPNLANYATTPSAACTYQRCVDWVNKVSAALPNGASQLGVDPSGAVGVTVTWSVANEGTHTYVLATSIN